MLSFEYVYQLHIISTRDVISFPLQLSNEFKFPVASFHHAGETYLVPDLLKKAWVKFAFDCTYVLG